MAEEYLDIVDENNVLTGEKRLRSEIHSKGLWHRTVHIYFFRKRENHLEFLVHLRSKHKDLHPNRWDTRFGGHLKSGESVDEAVREEINEELGLIIDSKQLLRGPVQKGEDGSNKEFTYSFFYNFDGDLSDLNFSDGEVQEIKWASVDEIISGILQNPEQWVSQEIKHFRKIVDELEKCLHNKAKYLD